MRKNWITVLVAAAVAIGVLLAAFSWPFFFGEPALRLEYFPPPPWKVKAGDSLQVTVGIPNDGRGTARGVRLSLWVPEGFTGFVAGTNESEATIGTIHGGDGKSSDFVISISSGVLPGNYVVRVTLSGENVPEQVSSQVVEVQA